jgi:hypothetical protein
MSVGSNELHMSELPKPDFARNMRIVESADVFVDAAGLIYSTDYNAGLFILEFERQ